LLLARELASDPRALVLLNPTRGLDVGAAEELYRLLADLRDRGRAILLITTELDEVLRVADRFAVLSRGTWREADRPDRELLGAMMLGEPA
jgi:simple sugar transport system ATP-binding protein